MRDLMLFSAMFVLVPLAFMNSFAAYLVWGWTAVLTPSNYLYGFMKDARLNMLFAVFTIVLVVLGRVRGAKFKSTRTTNLLLIFIIHASLCAAFSYDNNRFNAYYYENFLKACAFSLLMPLFATSRVRLHALLIMISLGLGFHGAVEGLKMIKSGGGHVLEGIPGSMLSDNNHLATGLAIVLPILFYLYLHSARKIVKLGFLAVLVLTTVTILGSKSRGGFLAMAVVGFWFIMTSRKKLLSLLLVASIGLALFYFAPESWLARVDSIQDASDDSSFMGRVIAWKISTAIALNNPVFGGGFHALQVQYIWDMFKQSQGLLGFVNTPVPEFTAKAAHSIYFETMGDLGFVGFGLFFSLLVNSLITRSEIKKMVKKAGPKLLWARDMADMLGLSIIAYMVGGAAVSLGYLEVIYIVLVLMEMLKQHVISAVKVPVVAPPAMLMPAALPKP